MMLLDTLPHSELYPPQTFLGSCIKPSLTPVWLIFIITLSPSSPAALLNFPLVMSFLIPDATGQLPPPYLVLILHNKDFNL